MLPWSFWKVTELAWSIGFADDLGRSTWALNNLRFNQAPIICWLNIQPARSLDLDGLAKNEQYLVIVGNFNATAIRPWLPLKFQVHALKLCRAKGVRTRVRRTLTATTSKELDLQWNRLWSGGKIAAFSYQFERSIGGRLIAKLPLTVKKRPSNQWRHCTKSRSWILRESSDNGCARPRFREESTQVRLMPHPCLLSFQLLRISLPTLCNCFPGSRFDTSLVFLFK